MPVYDFRCERCGELFEVVAGFAELEEKSACPACGGHTLRVYGAVLLGGKRTSVRPDNFVRPHGPASARRSAPRAPQGD